MKIEVETIIEGCADRCPDFSIETVGLYSDNGKMIRVYKCEHLSSCKARSSAEEEAKNELRQMEMD